jgi:arylsulfatase
MKKQKLKLVAILLAALTVVWAAERTVIAQQRGKKPNILFIMGDDIGWMQPSCYHRGLMVGETPNIDRLANEGGLFMTYYAESSCTAGRCAFITGMHPYRAGMVLPPRAVARGLAQTTAAPGEHQVCSQIDRGQFKAI